LHSELLKEHPFEQLLSTIAEEVEREVQEMVRRSPLRTATAGVPL